MRHRRDYAFELPPAQIAQTPADRRDGARLLVVGADGGLADRRFPDVVDAIPRDAVVVVNDTRVIPARVHAHKDTGGNVELLFLDPGPDARTWRCLARARRPLRTGQVLRTEHGDLVLASDRADDGTVLVTTPPGMDTLDFLARAGEVPLPPYIDRAPVAADAERYQTVYARAPGAVAAPTAGLHFTPELLDALRARGAAIATLTLHVGAGTFAPMRVDEVADHVMHVERYEVPGATAALIASGRPVVAVGTTVVRALESAAVAQKQVKHGPGETRLFIHPGSGHTFRVVDHLITNFHLPESTLLMLVCAFAGTARTFAAYRHAVASGYRFFSYGDAMVISRAEPS